MQGSRQGQVENTKERINVRCTVMTLATKGSVWCMSWGAVCEWSFILRRIYNKATAGYMITKQHSGVSTIADNRWK